MRNSIATTHDETRSREGELEDKLTLNGRKILGERCVEENLLDDNGDILIYLPEELIDPNIFIDTHQWFRVLLVGEDCRYLTQELVDENDVYMRWALFGDKIHAIGDSLWIIEESLIDDGTNASPVIYIN